MRRYHIKQGNYIGDHFIFDTEQECAVYLKKNCFNANGQRFVISNHAYIIASHTLLDKATAKKYGLPSIEYPDTFPHWTDLEAKTGDWVRTDDGRIVQILNRYLMKRRKGRPTLQEQPEPMKLDTVYTRFCFASGAIYIKADGTLRYNYIHADLFVPGEYNRSSLTRKTTTMNKDRKLFAYYLAIVGNPVKAYHLTWPGHYTNKLLYKAITKRALALMRDRKVIQEFLSYMEIDEYRKALQTSADEQGVNTDLLMHEIVRGVQGAKPGTEDHRKMMEILTLALERMNNVEVITSKGEPARVGAVNAPDLIPEPKAEIKEQVKKNTPELLP